MKTFNTAGTCRPNEHYMVDITERLEIIREMVAKGNYFCINRGRQYGKTTTLTALQNTLEKLGYTVFSLSFEGMAEGAFLSLNTVLYRLVQKINDCILWDEVKNISETTKALLDELEKSANASIDDVLFSRTISKICKTEKAVLLIDEVDQARNSASFIQFLGFLREMYLKRDTRPTFQSVILAGVYDIKNLKLKIRTEDEHQYNSPWNIAVPFDVDMSLSAKGITGMLAEYKADHNLTFDEVFLGQMIRDYTAGYPFLVSRICQIIDAEQYPWDKEGVLKAVNAILVERNTLFDNMIKKLDEYPELKQILKGILFSGKVKSYNPDEKYVQIASMFNYISNKDGKIAIACRIMETRLYNLFISEEENSSFFRQGQIDKSQFIRDGVIDMAHLMERFVVHMNQTYKMDHDNEFIEDDGRKVFLTYLRPVINGIGSYHIEEQTRDHDRMDVVIDYLGKQYVIELKIWRGNAYNERGEDQLCRYLEYFDLQKGYLLSFCFNKTKKSGLLPPVELKGRTLIEAIV
ncbi:MAG: AAA-like domain-containing protein [Bacteroidaceae bacterium]|nr:AAA-like domain-containing protein [Bacteroidaceae bacterium]